MLQLSRLQNKLYLTLFFCSTLIYAQAQTLVLIVNIKHFQQYYCVQKFSLLFLFVAKFEIDNLSNPFYVIILLRLCLYCSIYRLLYAYYPLLSYVVQYC